MNLDKSNRISFGKIGRLFIIASLINLIPLLLVWLFVGDCSSDECLIYYIFIFSSIIWFVLYSILFLLLIEKITNNNNLQKIIIFSPSIIISIGAIIWGRDFNVLILALLLIVPNIILEYIYYRKLRKHKMITPKR